MVTASLKRANSWSFDDKLLVQSLYKVKLEAKLVGILNHRINCSLLIFLGYFVGLGVCLKDESCDFVLAGY